MRIRTRESDSRSCFPALKRIAMLKGLYAPRLHIDGFFVPAYFRDYFSPT